MAGAISAPDLYKKCKEAAIASGFGENEIPACRHSSFNFGHKILSHILPWISWVKWKSGTWSNSITFGNLTMTTLLFSNLRILAWTVVTHKDHAAFVSTDDKNKIKIGDPKCPITAATRGKRVIVATNQLLQTADHGFPIISVMSTVVLLHHIPADVEDSWYNGIPNIYLKLHATEPSTAARNAK